MPLSIKYYAKLSRDPLVLFAVCGFLIFVIFESLEDKQVTTVSLSTETRTHLVEDFEAITGRKASSMDIAQIEQSYITEELLFREALKAGIHLFDPNTRESLIKIMRSRITALIQEPSEEELVSYYAQHIQAYYTEPLLSFEHIYFSALPITSHNIKTRLQSGDSVSSETFPHGNNFHRISESMVRGTFGVDFLTATQTLELGVWQGPVVSQYGVHYLRLHERVVPKPRPYSQARNNIENDYIQTKIDLAVATKVLLLETQYEIRIEP